VVRVAVASDPRDPALVYDPATRTLTARPAKVLVDRLQDILANPNFSDLQTAYNALSAANKTRIRDGLARLLGRQRFRASGESVEL
jgi:hypothetical protein